MKRASAKERNRQRAAHERALRLVPATGRVEDLVENVAAAAGRAVSLVPFQLGRGEPTGLWIATDTADYVIYPASASSAERTAVICHELSHMLLRHQPVGEGARLAELAANVAPDIDPAVAQRMLARHGYGQDAEAEAEHLATRLVARLASCADRIRLEQDTISTRLR